MIPSAQVWFAGGERVGYDPNARVMVATEDSTLRIFLRQEGIPAQACTPSSPADGRDRKGAAQVTAWPANLGKLVDRPWVAAAVAALNQRLPSQE